MSAAPKTKSNRRDVLESLYGRSAVVRRIGQSKIKIMSCTKSKISVNSIKRAAINLVAI